MSKRRTAGSSLGALAGGCMRLYFHIKISLNIAMLHLHDLPSNTLHQSMALYCQMLRSQRRSKQPIATDILPNKDQLSTSAVDLTMVFIPNLIDEDTMSKNSPMISTRPQLNALQVQRNTHKIRLQMDSHSSKG